MTTKTRLGGAPLRWLPLIAPGFLLLFAVLLAPVAPAMAIGGLYRVDTPEFSVVDGFDCTGNAADVTCTVPVAGRVLTVEAHSGHDRVSCDARYDGRDLNCDRVTQYGPASPWVRLSSLGVPASDAPDAPWWRDVLDLWWERAWLAAFPVLGLLAGLAAFLLYRGPRLEDGDRRLRTVITGVLTWVVPAAGTLLVVPWDRADLALTALILPHVVLLPACLVTWWQYVAAGPLSGRLRDRVGQAAIAFLATALTGAGGLLWLAMVGGLPD